MKRKTIDAIHEVRLTIVQVIIPAGVAALYIDGKYPGLKYKIKDELDYKKREMESKFREFKNRKEKNL